MKKYVINFINFIKYLVKFGDFCKRNLIEQNLTKVEDLYTEESIYWLNSFLTDKYSEDLNSLQKKIKIYFLKADIFRNELGCEFIAAFLKWKGDNYRIITNNYAQRYGRESFENRFNSEFLIHELTHYYQMNGKASLFERIMASFDNFHYMITGNPVRYNENKLE